MTTENHAHGRAPGDVIAGRYRLVRRVGEGGMGEVWHAHDASLDEHVALKLVTAATPNAAERFRREVKLARRVVHPHCARVFDLGDDPRTGQLFLTMELVDGTSLAKLMHEHRLSPGALWTVLADVCGALAAVHAVGVVHRDLKPGNILVDKKGHGVIIDFGVARDLEDASPALTRGAIGTFDFMAPEQVDHGHDVTPAADIYALGTIMFACAARRLPFVDGNEAKRAFDRTLGPAPTLAGMPSGLVPALSTAMIDIVDRCLRRDAAARPTLDEIHRVLEDEERRERERAQVGTETAFPLPEHEHEHDDEVAAHADLGDDKTTADQAPVEARDGNPEDMPGASAAAPGRRRVLVSPFTGDDEIGPLVAEELADALAAVRGLEVISPRSIDVSTPLHGEGAIVQLARKLGATHVVVGQVAPGDRVMDVDAKLLSVARAHTRAQPRPVEGGGLWREHFRAGAAEIFGNGGTLPRRIAEALRVELDAVHSDEVPHEAAVLYMRARTALRRVAVPGIMETLALVDECLELAPNWRPAVAARAMACARARFVATDVGEVISYDEAAAAVQKALLIAPDLADSHYAGAMFAMEEARFAEGVDRLRATLHIAPMHALALMSLGRFEVELGRVHDGIGRIKEAVRIDPAIGGGLSMVAREYAMRGRAEDAMRVIARARALADGIDVWGATIRTRAWLGGPTDDVTEVIARMGEPQDAMRSFVHAHARFVASQGKDGGAREEIHRWLQMSQAVTLGPRVKSFILQLGAEIFAESEPDAALDYLEGGARIALVDIDWLLHCPVFARFRADRTSRFGAVVDITRARAAAAWPAERSRHELVAGAASTG